jgi:hypothetical protein
MNETAIMSVMAAIIYTAYPERQKIRADQLDKMYDGVAQQAWDLFQAVQRTSSRNLARG